MGFPVVAYVLRVSADRGEELFQIASEYWERPVSHPVPKFGVSGRTPIVVFASFHEDAITHIALGKRGPRAGTGMVQLQMHELDELTRPFPFSEIESHVPAQVRRHLFRYFHSGGVLPDRTGNAFVDFMVQADESVADRMSRIEYNTPAPQRFSPRAEENLALQKDTVGVALRIAGVEHDQLAGWRVGEHPPRSFLDGLPGARVREDAMIQADFSTIPGFDQIRNATHIATQPFQSRRDPSNRVTVIMANRRPLEQQTGVDLIYYNEKYRSFVMVQYKAMEQEGGEERFRWAEGDQFAKELARMEFVWRTIRTASVGDAPAAFRFSNNPFFLKFCSRVVFEPDSTKMFQGMYLPLDLWHRLRQSGAVKGPKGGNVVTCADVERSMNNSEFINVVSKSWVGTSEVQSDILESVIREVLTTGKTITLAVKQRGDRPHSVNAPGQGSVSDTFSSLFE